MKNRRHDPDSRAFNQGFEDAVTGRAWGNPYLTHSRDYHDYSRGFGDGTYKHLMSPLPGEGPPQAI